MSELDEKRYQRTGQLTPDYLMQETLKHFAERKAEGAPVKRLVIVALFEDGEIETGYTDGSTLEHIGMLEWAKTQAIERINE